MGRRTVSRRAALMGLGGAGLAALAVGFPRGGDAPGVSAQEATRPRPRGAVRP